MSLESANAYCLNYINYLVISFVFNLIFCFVFCLFFLLLVLT
jgi:hypothetical protein